MWRPGARAEPGIHDVDRTGPHGSQLLPQLHRVLPDPGDRARWARREGQRRPRGSGVRGLHLPQGPRPAGAARSRPPPAAPLAKAGRRQPRANRLRKFARRRGRASAGHRGAPRAARGGRLLRHRQRHQSGRVGDGAFMADGTRLRPHLFGHGHRQAGRQYSDGPARALACRRAGLRERGHLVAGGRQPGDRQVQWRADEQPGAAPERCCRARHEADRHRPAAQRIRPPCPCPSAARAG